MHKGLCEMIRRGICFSAFDSCRQVLEILGHVYCYCSMVQNKLIG